jgi:hypothetical protein
MALGDGRPKGHTTIMTAFVIAAVTDPTPARRGVDDDSATGRLGRSHAFVLDERWPLARTAGAAAVREPGASRYATWDGRRPPGRDVARM